MIFHFIVLLACMVGVECAICMISTMRIENISGPDGMHILQCIAKGDDPIVLEWLGPDILTQPDQIGLTLSIRVHPLTTSTYTCRGTRKNKMKQVSVTIEVDPDPYGSEGAEGSLGAVTILPSGDPMVITKGDSLNLTCSATGNPTPTLTFDGFPEARLNPSGQLELVDTPIEDRTYVCRAESLVGVTEASKQVQVADRSSGKPVITIRPQETTVLVRKGSTLEIACIAIGVPKPEVFWNVLIPTTAMRSLASDDQPPTQTTVARLSIEEISEDRIYTCTAENSHGEATVDVEVYVI